MISGLYQLIINDFKLIKDVHDDGIAVITSLAFASKEKFQRFIPEFFDYLKVGLDKYNEKEVFKVSLDFIAQISKNCP